MKAKRVGSTGFKFLPNNADQPDVSGVTVPVTVSDPVPVTREIYPNAPLQFVAFEVRFAPYERLHTQRAFASFHAGLKDLLPMAELSPVTEGPDGSRMLEPEPILYRFLNEARTRAVTVRRHAVAIEIVDYTRFSDFRLLIESAARPLAEALAGWPIRRVGLRYFDEIRVPSVDAPSDWHSYLNPALLGPIKLSVPGELTSLGGAFQVDVDHGRHVVVRYGTLPESAVVNRGPLLVKPTEEGPVFMLDTDSFWQGGDDEEVKPSDLAGFANELRAPITGLFEDLITDRLREEVLRVGGHA